MRFMNELFIGSATTKIESLWPEGLLQKSRSRLVLMENALADAGKKNFGICIRCGQNIPRGHILLMPESKKCVRCA